jgi:hypothetical protein
MKWIAKLKEEGRLTEAGRGEYRIVQEVENEVTTQ